MAEPTGPIASSIKEKIASALKPTHIDIVDDSSKHRGHAAMKGLNPEETHFSVTVVSEEFAGKPMVKRHQLIYSLLDEELKVKGLHALGLTTKTPDEWEKLQSKR
ncbi:bola-like protein [Gonapodya prolifera JEL478]|uniref:Bola-like protein n=1 Tax=Gonapodya prolifera (strain JEL478) TaxID=1344416 RepID=A0A139ALS7_GONPJ|nr:bola-like protein [Gonapodya prolifera JEL478]|eukprot:KXS17405.1 bola-like protein [Gonapodya prolifera JEL478]